MSKENREKRRRRVRPWLLGLLLLALIALLVLRPGLRRDAVDSARAAIVNTLDLSPRAVYALRLRIAGLDDSALGERWRTAVARAAAQATPVPDTYSTQAQFAADRVQAHVYAFALERGQALQLRLVHTGAGDGRLFASLERRKHSDSTEDGGWDTVAWLDNDGHAQRWIIDRDGDYRVVLQPELAAEVGYAIAIAHGGSLDFPVAELDTRTIGSGFGDPRDGGARAHHGADIFAARGTPVVAVADGRVRTGVSDLGGRHVWLSSGMLGIGGARYYYAHLDTIAVDNGSRVAAGDVLGTVGNTGNARTTPPHLHFGIYTASGPVDPAPFLQAPPRLPAAGG